MFPLFLNSGRFVQFHHFCFNIILSSLDICLLPWLYFEFYYEHWLFTIGNNTRNIILEYLNFLQLVCLFQFSAISYLN